MLEDNVDNKINSLEDINSEEKYSKVYNLGIYELRGLARALGVPSPTTKKRDYLVSAILERLDKNEVELVQRSGKGRPFKRMEGMDSILNIIEGQNIKQFEKDKEYTYDDIIMFAQETPVFDVYYGEESEKQGVIRAIKNSAYFIDIESEGTVFIDEDLISKYNIRNGDFIKGRACVINGKKQFRMTSIFSINGVDSKEYVAIAEKKSSKILPTNYFKVADRELLCGSRNVLIVDEPVFLDENNIKLLTSNFKDFDRIIAVGVNLCAEDVMLFNSLDSRTFKFISEYGKDNKSRNFDCVVDAINLCERFIANGDKVLFFVYDIMNIINALDLFFEHSNMPLKMGHNIQTTVIIEKLISLSAVYLDGTNCTQLFICDNLDLSDLFVKSSVIKICKRIK